MNNIVKFYRLTIELSDSYHALNKTITDDFSSMENMKKFCDEYGFIIGGEQGSGYKNGKGDWYVDESDDLLYIGGERRPSNTTHYGCSYCNYETLYREK
tara:strand:+ start:1467 stop:1763 length:297 start_codon:yes stop_codon:yes gene_type:complete